MNKPKTKIVIGINDFIIGGAQKLIADLLLRFDHDTFEFHLITLMQFDDRENFFDLVSDKVKIHRLKFKGFIDLSSWRKLFKLLRDIKPDIVWSHLFFSNTIFRVLSIFLKYKCIINEHNTYIWKNFFQKMTDRFLARYTYKIVAVSETVLDFTSKQEKIPRDKFQVIHNGIDFFGIEDQLKNLNKNGLRGKYNIPISSKVFINVGRLTHQKNHQLTIEAFAKFLKNNPDSYLFLVGGGGLEKRLKDLVIEKEIESNVKFFGAQQNVFPFLAMSDIFISTSFIEGFGISHIEAMACGLPVLSTKTAGPDKFINEGVNGYFIDYDISDVFEKMNLLINADNIQLKKNVKVTAESFDINQTVKKYQELFLSSTTH